MKSSMRIAVIDHGGELSADLRAALAGLGVGVAIEMPAAGFDRRTLVASGARVIVVNIGEGRDIGAIPALQALFATGDYEIVINDAQATAQLAKADQARWARHLAAKVAHHPEAVLPPVINQRVSPRKIAPLPKARFEPLPRAGGPASRIEPVRKAEPAPTKVEPVVDVRPEPQTNVKAAPVTVPPVAGPPPVKASSAPPPPDEAESSAADIDEDELMAALERIDAETSESTGQDFDAMFLDGDDIQSPVLEEETEVAPPAPKTVQTQDDWSKVAAVPEEASESQFHLDELSLEPIDVPPATESGAPAAEQGKPPSPPAKKAQPAAPEFDLSGLSLAPIEVEEEAGTAEIPPGTVFYDSGTDLDPQMLKSGGAPGAGKPGR